MGAVSEYLKYAHSNRKMLCFRQERTTQYGSENEFSDTLLAILISSALFVEEYRNHDNGNRQSQQEMNMSVEGIGYRDAKKP